MEQKKKFKVELDSSDNIRELLQVIYQEADEQMKLAVAESAKLTSSTRLNEEIMDAKSKYCKSLTDFMNVKQKAMDIKLDIAKLMATIYQNQGNVKGAVEEAKKEKLLSPDFFNRLKTTADKAKMQEESGGKEIYNMGRNIKP